MDVSEKLSLRVRASYSIGHVLNDVFASMWFSYLLIYFQVVLNAGPVRAGILMFIGQIADALATPFVGYHSDTSPPSKYGRRKSWHLFGTFCVALSFPFIFSPCVECATSGMDAQMVYYAAFIIIFQIGWASVQVSHLALIPELSNDRHHRTQLTALRYTFTVLSNVGVYLVTWLVLHISKDSSNQIGPEDVGKFQHVVWVGLAVGSVCSVIFHCFLQEPPSTPLPPGQIHNVTHSTILKKASFYQVALVYMCTRLSVNLNQSLLPLYLHITLQLPGTALASVPLSCFLSSLLGSFVVNTITKASGRRLAYALGAMPIVGACFWIFFGTGDFFKTYEIYFVAVLLGGGGAIILVTSLGLTADLIGSATHTSAFVFGAMSFTDKLANGLAVILIQRLSVDLDGVSFYRWAIALGCGAPALLATITLLFPIKESGIGMNDEEVEEERAVLPHAEAHVSDVNEHHENVNINSEYTIRPT